MSTRTPLPTEPSGGPPALRWIAVALAALALTLASCSDPDSATALDSHGAQLQVWIDGAAADALQMTELAYGAGISADVHAFPAAELTARLAEVLPEGAGPDLVVTDAVCTPLWCREPWFDDPPELPELPFTPLCDPRWCDPPESGLAGGLPVGWGFVGTFTRPERLAEFGVEPPRDVAALLELAEGEPGAVGWIGTPVPDPWGSELTAVWPSGDQVRDGAPVPLPFDAGVLLGHSDGLPALLERGAVAPLPLDDALPVVTTERAYAPRGSDPAARDLIALLTSPEAQWARFEATGVLPTVDALQPEIEARFGELLDYGLSNR